MATAYIRFGKVMGGGAPVYVPTPSASQNITTSSSSQQSTITAVDGDYATISAVGGVIRIAIGQNPAAIAGAGAWILDGGTIDVGPLKYGDKVAVIDAA